MTTPASTITFPFEIKKEITFIAKNAEDYDFLTTTDSISAEADRELQIWASDYDLEIKTIETK